MNKVLIIANQKGGVGKTTTAVNLSVCLSEKGKKVLLVDIDPQGNATSGLGINKKKIKHSIYDVIINGLNPSEVIVSAGGIDVLPSNIDLAGAEVELVGMASREMALSKAIEPIKSEYDCIVIDSPPSLGLLTLNGLSAADEVMIPIQCEFYALEGLSQLMNTIKLVKKHLNPRLEVEGITLTMFDARTNLSLQVVEEVKKYFKGKVHSVIIPRNVRLGEAPSHGIAISKYDPKCMGALAYIDLAEEYISNN